MNLKLRSESSFQRPQSWDARPQPGSARPSCPWSVSKPAKVQALIPQITCEDAGVFAKFGAHRVDEIGEAGSQAIRSGLSASSGVIAAIVILIFIGRVTGFACRGARCSVHDPAISVLSFKAVSIR